MVIEALKMLMVADPANPGILESLKLLVYREDKSRRILLDRFWNGGGSLEDQLESRVKDMDLIKSLSRPQVCKIVKREEHSDHQEIHRKNNSRRKMI